MNIHCKFIAILLLFACEVANSSESNYDIIAKLDSGPGNVTVMDNGRIIMSMHQFYQPKYTVVEYKNKSLVPFPNKELAAA
ncbi:MAG: L-dopachrome tautomerase-related protein, partial [Gammaproteobacteria bacterium]